MKLVKTPLLILLSAVAFSCSKKATTFKNSKRTSTNPGNTSSATGIPYKDGEFFVEDYKSLEGPNLIYIEGGRTTLGAIQENPLYVKDNVKRTVTIPSFYMDETEIANIHWVEYLFYLKKDSAQEVYESARPDTAVWAQELAFNDSYVDNYLRHPGFRYFPVVGVSWVQANNYCKWRTDAVNAVLREEYSSSGQQGAEGKIQYKFANRLPGYRLPTEAEWEFAALALIGTQKDDEINEHNRIYPWDGTSLRPLSVNEKKRAKVSTYYANFKRGRGDYAGIAGRMNDGAMTTDWIYENAPNDYGLYNMAGNVSEWVYDIYRPMSYQDVSDFSPVRNSGYLDEEKNYDASGGNSLIDDHVRVYKGGSWLDGPYWLSPGTRRYMNENESTATIGFRCAMISVGEHTDRRNRKEKKRR